MREHPDGSITFPCRGKAPTPTDPRYEVDPCDPYRWILKYNRCNLRVLNQEYRCPLSGRIGHRDFCPQLLLPINPRYCNVDCSVPEGVKNG